MTGGGIRELERLRAATEGKARAGLAGRLRTLAGGVRRRAARLLKAPGATASARRRRPDDAALLPPHYRIVEMTGPSCIGKSTLHRQAIAHLQCDWQATLPRTRRAGQNLPEAEIHAMKAVLRRRLEAGAARLGDDRSDGADLSTQLIMLERFWAIMRSELAMREDVASGRSGYFLDGAMFHFSTFPSEHFDDDTLRHCLDRRALVFVALKDPEVMLARIGQRASTGSNLSGYVDCASVEDILARVEARLERDAAFQLRCARLGTPTLTIFGDDPTETNIRHLRAFEAALMEQAP